MPAQPPVHPAVDSLLDLFLAGRPSAPDAHLLRTPAGDVWTYRDLDERSGRVASVLAARGVGVGDRVVVQVEKSPEALALYVGCLRAGAVFVPLNPAYREAEVAHVLVDAEPRLIVAHPDRPMPSGAPGVLTLDAAGGGTLAAATAGVAAVEPPDQVPVGPDSIAALLYTSGTTGRPKGVPLRHRHLTANARALVAAWGFTADDVLLHVLPIFHAHGLFVAVHCVLASGASMRFDPSFDVGRTLEALPGSTVFMGVPTHYSRLLADPRLDRARCESVRLFVSGSAPLTAATHGAFRARTGQEILERYGMTETVMLTSNPLRGERRPGTVGLPLPGVEVRIAHPAEAPGVPGSAGAVEVRGPSVFDGYWRRPELRATEFTPDGWFRTGDVGRLDDDGYLHLVGRSKDLVITGGLNVYPKEVEEVLDALPGVEESAVVGVPDPDFGEAVVALVVAQRGASLDPAGLRAAAREQLAAFKVPKRVHLVDELPRNAMGKVQKAELRARFCDGADVATRPAGGTTAIS